MNNFDKYNVYKEVEDTGQQVIGSRFVLTEKSDGSIKARFVIKGFQEQDVQADSPTASRETLKVFCAITANENWKVEGSDVSAAFLQSKPLKREVYIQPPQEKKRKGYIWQLIKPAYGLNDASRYWYETLKETLLELGMQQSLRDSCLFYFTEGNELHGLVLIHVDDILASRSIHFENEIMKKIRQAYTFGKVSASDFIYTGIRIYQEENYDIFIDQNDFIRNLDSFQYKKQRLENTLDIDENRLLRKTVGQLSWAASQTRPDLAFNALDLSTKLNSAKFSDAKQSLKALKKMQRIKIFN